MLRKAFALSVAWYAFAIILAGCSTNCNCIPQPTYKFRWTSLAVKTHAYSMQDWIVSESPDTSTDFTAKSLVIKARLDFELIAGTQCPGSSIINQAYACSCPTPSYRPDPPLSSLKVISVQPFDGSHPAMSDVTEFFKSKNYNAQGQPDGLKDLDLRLDQRNEGAVPQIDYNLYLYKRPDIGTDHQFSIVFTLKDSSTITATTPVVRF